MDYENDWDTAEPRLGAEWAHVRSGSGLTWEQARPASRAAWDRVDLQRGGASGMGLRGPMAGEPAAVEADDLAASRAPRVGGTDMAGMNRGFDDAPDNNRGAGAAGTVGAAQSAGNTGGDRDDVIDALQDLVECSKDGEYGFSECADQARRADLKSIFLQRADDCRRGAEELNQLIRSLGGSPKDSGSAAGAMHRGWVAVRSALTTYDDRAVLQEAERGEDNAVARYRKALKQPLPDHVRQVVERQFQQVQRNHDEVKRLRDSA
jgi:uncharacterized protein (TIGR02284 family)